MKLPNQLAFKKKTHTLCHWHLIQLSEVKIVLVYILMKCNTSATINKQNVAIHDFIYWYLFPLTFWCFPLCRNAPGTLICKWCLLKLLITTNQLSLISSGLRLSRSLPLIVRYPRETTERSYKFIWRSVNFNDGFQ